MKISHQIDFKSHGTSKNWIGHWSYSDVEWKLIRGKFVYLINREPLSTQINIMKMVGFKIIKVIPEISFPKEKYDKSISRDQLEKRFYNLSDRDIMTTGAYILSIKN